MPLVKSARWFRRFDWNDVFGVVRTPDSSCHFLGLRSKLRPPLLRSSANPRPGSGGQDALLYDFQFFARGMTERFSSRSNATQLALYLA